MSIVSELFYIPSFEIGIFNPLFFESIFASSYTINHLPKIKSEGFPLQNKGCLISRHSFLFISHYGEALFNTHRGPRRSTKAGGETSACNLPGFGHWEGQRIINYITASFVKMQMFCTSIYVCKVAIDYYFLFFNAFRYSSKSASSCFEMA